jgi:hypothetical protein
MRRTTTRARADTRRERNKSYLVGDVGHEELGLAFILGLEDDLVQGALVDEAGAVGAPVGELNVLVLGILDSMGPDAGLGIEVIGREEESDLLLSSSLTRFL